nr:MarR family transcriptional regulator [bacterium]
MEGAEFRMALWQALNAVKTSAATAFAPVVQAEGLTMLQAYVLMGIHMGAITNITSLCRQLEVSQGNASALCKKLEQQGLITRARSQVDERVVTLSIAPGGRQVLDNIDRGFADFERFVRQQPDGDLQAILQGFAALRAMLKAYAAQSAK